MPVIIIPMQQKAVMHHLLVFLPKYHEIPRRYGQVFPFIPKRMHRLIEVLQLLPFVLIQFFLPAALRFFYRFFIIPSTLHLHAFLPHVFRLGSLFRSAFFQSAFHLSGFQPVVHRPLRFFRGFFLNL